MMNVRCPICERWMRGERAAWPQFPFCSPRCRGIDLGRWLTGAYRIPMEDGEEVPAADAEDVEAP
jgi:endogenous inhibitor of DNA gyrase (YacG/DUF329 family)